MHYKVPSWISRIHFHGTPDVPISVKCYKWMLPYTFGYGSAKTQLNIVVNDATGALLGAYYDEQETFNGYYHVLSQIDA
jgi:hypothetical protein